MTREELIKLVKRIATAEGTEEEINGMIELLKKNVHDPRITKHIFYSKMTPEEVVDRALAYKPIHL